MSDAISIVRAVEIISDGMKRIGEPLTEAQYMMLAGQMGVLLNRKEMLKPLPQRSPEGTKT